MKTKYDLFFTFQVNTEAMEQGGKITVTTPSPITSDKQLQLMENEISDKLGVINVSIKQVKELV